MYENVDPQHEWGRLHRSPAEKTLLRSRLVKFTGGRRCPVICRTGIGLGFNTAMDRAVCGGVVMFMLMVLTKGQRGGPVREPGLRRACFAGALAPRPDPEKLQPVFDFGVAVVAGERGLEAGEFTTLNLEDAAAAFAKEMMVVMRVLIVPGEFKSGLAVAQFDAAHQAHIFEQCDGAVDSGQICMRGGPAAGRFLALSRGGPVAPWLPGRAVGNG